MDNSIDTLDSASAENILIGCGAASHVSSNGKPNKMHAPYFLLKGYFTFFKGSQYLLYNNQRITINGIDNLLHPSNHELRKALDDEANKLAHAGQSNPLPAYSSGKRHNVLIDCSWASNYYHFNIDVLGKVLVTSKFLELSECQFILNCWKPFQRDILNACKLRCNWVGYDSLYSSTLFVPSLAAPSGAAVLETLRFVKSQFPLIDSSSYSKYIYISRRSSKRKILNEDELLLSIQKLAPFQLVDLDNMNILDQIGIFQNAEVVVGSHGAGLVNCLHMINPIGVFEIFGSNYQARMFENMCSQLNIVYGSSGATSNLLGAGQVGNWSEDYHVDIKFIINDLNNFLAQLPQ